MKQDLPELKRKKSQLEAKIAGRRDKI